MKRSLKSNIRLRAIIGAFVLMFFANVAAEAAYCAISYMTYSSGLYMFINQVELNSVVVQKWDVARDKSGVIVSGSYCNPASTGTPSSYKGIQAANAIPLLQKAKSYTARVFAGNSYVTYDAKSSYPENVTPTVQYAQDYHIYIDFDQNGTFETSERVAYYDATGSEPYGTTTVTIPSTAKTGRTTMRILCDYYGQNGGYLGPCSVYYGEGRDFYIDIAAGYDIGITKISSPTNPLSVGLNPVKAMLKNYATSGSTVTKCTINWTVDGVSQPAYNWTGSLGLGQEIEVTLGNYNFVSKGVKTSYTLTARSSLPNGSDDGNTSNDASPAVVLAIPLPTGTYTVGGTSPTFATLKEATDLINSVGISGNGNVIFNIRPGTQTGPFIMDNFVHGTNNFIFQPDPANPGVVTITAATNSLNYVWYINNIPNISFKNLAFTVTNPSSYGGRIFMVRGNADNLTYENNTLTGMNIIDQTSYKFSLIDCQASQMNNQIYYKNTFSYGNMSLVLMNAARNSSGLLIDQNTFNPFTNRAINVEGIANGVISKNTLRATTTASYGGIMVTNGTTITNNTITGLMGINTSASAISDIHTSYVGPATITGNNINTCIGVNGISVTGIAGGSISDNMIDLVNTNANLATSGIIMTSATLGTNKVVLSQNDVSIQNGNGVVITNYPVDILKNKINVEKTASNVNLKTVSATGSNGMILLNELISASEAINLNNSNFTVAYNSTVSVGSTDLLVVNNGNNKIYRNQFVNRGTGKAFAINTAGAVTLDGNNYVTAGSSLGTIAGASYVSISQLASFDNNARNDEPMYKTNYNLKVTEFHDELTFNYPLKNITWPAGYQALYEEMTMDGISKKGYYYIGAYIILPTLELIGFSDDLIDCSGAPDRSISVSAATSTDQTPKYQWYKDGLLLQGETEHILKFEPFDYSVSATYTCKVYCPGFGTLTTGTIPVYALTIPAIVEQPKEVINAGLGKNYSFNVKVHYRGILPPFYKDAFQWYKYDAAKKDSVPLKNDSRFAGATSSDLTIRNLKDIDICKPGDFYFVKIEGECGTVFSNPFVISKTPEVVFRDHPENLNPCPGADVVFISNAVAPEGFNLTYQWMKDGVDLTNSTKCNGVTTNKLQVFGVVLADQGNYVCKATIASVPTTKSSNAGILKLRDIPTATASGETTITTKRGNNVTLLVNLIKGSEPLTVKWYYNGELIKEALWSIYDGDKLLTIVMEGANESQSGEYKCVLENECDKTEIVFNVTVTKWDEANSVNIISENGYSLYACSPNPSNGSTKIKFEMPETNNAVITLIDQSGRTVSTLFNGIANKGINVLDVNTSGMNISAGVYYYTINTNGFNASMPLVIVK